MNTLKTRIKLRRDIEFNFNRIGDELVLLKGEVVLVDTSTNLRVKVGDGVSTYNQLKFTDEYVIGLINNIVVRGYYYNGQFYVDKDHKEKYVPYPNKIYINNPDHCVYCWDEELGKYCTVMSVPDATDQVKGVMKLYPEHGENIDGTMTQKSISNAMDNIKLKLDEGEKECLILGAPW